MAHKTFFKQTATVQATSTTTNFEVKKPAKFSQTKAELVEPVVRTSPWKLWFSLAAVLFVGGFILSLIGLGWWYANRFEEAAGINLAEIIQSARSLNPDELFGDKGYLSIAVLGTDQAEGFRSSSLLTDTIMVVTIPQDGYISVLTIPRDLWIESLQTKVNALYYYGKQTDPDDGIVLVTSVLSEITGLVIDYSVIVSMDTFKATVNALDGITVEVERTFTDRFFPREIDVNSKDLDILYETISFEQGPTQMDGELALKFIRSRKSDDSFEGTDVGRERRQQVFLQALTSKLRSLTTIANPERMAQLYQVWKTDMVTTISDEMGLWLAVWIMRNQPEIVSIQIPVQDGESYGLLYHPGVTNGQQWVYKPNDPTWKELRLWIPTVLFAHQESVSQ